MTMIYSGGRTYSRSGGRESRQARGGDGYSGGGGDGGGGGAEDAVTDSQVQEAAQREIKYLRQKYPGNEDLIEQNQQKIESQIRSELEAGSYKARPENFEFSSRASLEPLEKRRQVLQQSIDKRVREREVARELELEREYAKRAGRKFKESKARQELNQQWKEQGAFDRQLLKDRLRAYSPETGRKVFLEVDGRKYWGGAAASKLIELKREGRADYRLVSRQEKKGLEVQRASRGGLGERLPDFVVGTPSQESLDILNKRRGRRREAKKQYRKNIRQDFFGIYLPLEERAGTDNAVAIAKTAEPAVISSTSKSSSGLSKASAPGESKPVQMAFLDVGRLAGVDRPEWWKSAEGKVDSFFRGLWKEGTTSPTKYRPIIGQRFGISEAEYTQLPLAEKLAVSPKSGWFWPVNQKYIKSVGQLAESRIGRAREKRQANIGLIDRAIAAQSGSKVFQPGAVSGITVDGRQVTDVGELKSLRQDFAGQSQDYIESVEAWRSREIKRAREDVVGFDGVVPNRKATQLIASGTFIGSGVMAAGAPGLFSLKGGQSGTLVGQYGVRALGEAGLVSAAGNVAVLKAGQEFGKAAQKLPSEPMVQGFLATNPGLKSAYQRSGVVRGVVDEYTKPAAILAGQTALTFAGAAGVQYGTQKFVQWRAGAPTMKVTRPPQFKEVAYGRKSPSLGKTVSGGSGRQLQLTKFKPSISRPGVQVSTVRPGEVLVKTRYGGRQYSMSQSADLRATDISRNMRFYGGKADYTFTRTSWIDKANQAFDRFIGGYAAPSSTKSFNVASTVEALGWKPAAAGKIGRGMQYRLPGKAMQTQLYNLRYPEGAKSLVVTNLEDVATGQLYTSRAFTVTKQVGDNMFYAWSKGYTSAGGGGMGFRAGSILEPRYGEGKIPYRGRAVPGRQADLVARSDLKYFLRSQQKFRPGGRDILTGGSGRISGSAGRYGSAGFNVHGSDFLARSGGLSDMATGGGGGSGRQAGMLSGFTARSGGMPATASAQQQYMPGGVVDFAGQARVPGGSQFAPGYGFVQKAAAPFTFAGVEAAAAPSVFQSLPSASVAAYADAPALGKGKVSPFMMDEAEVLSMGKDYKPVLANQPGVVSGQDSLDVYVNIPQASVANLDMFESTMAQPSRSVDEYSYMGEGESIVYGEGAADKKFMSYDMGGFVPPAPYSLPPFMFLPPLIDMPYGGVGGGGMDFSAWRGKRNVFRGARPEEILTGVGGAADTKYLDVVGESDDYLAVVLSKNAKVDNGFFGEFMPQKTTKKKKGKSKPGMIDILEF